MALARVFCLSLLFSLAYAEEDVEEEDITELRDSLTWGRAFLGGAVSHHQFFKARFGGSITDQEHPVVIADPPLGCMFPNNAKEIKEKKAIVFVDRGECTFATKARFMQVAGASAVVVINEDDALQHLPGPDGADVTTGVAMVTKDFGEMVKTISARQPTSIRLIPILCTKETGQSLCLPVTDHEKEAHMVIEGGHMTVNKDPDFKAEFLAAKFGTPFGTTPMKLVLAEPSTGCTKLDEEKIRGKVIVLRRGGCNFLDKISNAQKAHAHAAIVINTQPGLLRLDSLKSYEAYNISISAAMITTEKGEALEELAKSGDIAVSFDVSANTVKASVWADLKAAVAAEQWSLEPEEAQEMYLNLHKEHKGSDERVLYLQDAFRDTGPEAEEFLEKSEL